MSTLEKKKVGPFGPETSADGVPAIPMWIDGHAYLTMPTHGFFDIRKAGSSEVIRRVPLCGADTVDIACQAAKKALSLAWPTAARGVFVKELDALLQRFAVHLAGLLREECGESFDGDAEVARLLDGCLRLTASSVPESAEKISALVVLADAPFAHPALAALARLMAGDALVLKPSVRSPSALHAFVEVTSRAGLPPGRCNVVHGDEGAVAALSQHALISNIICAGSGSAAEQVSRLAEAAGKPFHLPAAQLR